LLAALVAITALVAASDSSRTFTLTFPASHTTLAIAPLPVTLVDHAGLVVAIHEVPPNRPELVRSDGVTALPEHPSSLVARWIGGACDKAVAITLDGTTSALRLAIATTDGGGCRLVGLGRSIVLDLTAVIPPVNVTVAGQ
jgi:hypothetical protein